MRIGVISDTHIPGVLRSLPKSVSDAFVGVDAILHAGDAVSPSVFKVLEEIAPVTAVRGNMDNLDLKWKLPSKTIFTAGDVRIGLIHGDLSPELEIQARRYYDRTKQMDYETILGSLFDQFTGDNIDCIVFGHTHRMVIERQDSVLFFNPGAVCRYSRFDISSLGILDITSKEIRAELIRL